MSNLTNKIQLLIFDVDGTLSSGEDPIDNDVAKRLVILEKKGFRICLASGKDYYYLKALARGMGLTNVWLIAENGAVYFTETLHYTIPKRHTIDFTRTIMDEIRKLYPQVIFQPNDVVVTAWISDWEIKDKICNSLKKLGVIEGINVKFYIHAPSLDIIPENIDKSVALAKIKLKYNISSSQIIAVGDYINDICLGEEASKLIIIGSKLPDDDNYVKVDSIMGAFDYIEMNFCI